MSGERSTVVRAEFDSSDARLIIEVRRGLYAPPRHPNASDFPVDLREALIAWLLPAALATDADWGTGDE